MISDFINNNKYNFVIEWEVHNLSYEMYYIIKFSKRDFSVQFKTPSDIELEQMEKLYELARDAYEASYDIAFDKPLKRTKTK